MSDEDDTKGPNLPEGTDWEPDLAPGGPRQPEPIDPPGHVEPPITRIDRATEAEIEAAIARHCHEEDVDDSRLRQLGGLLRRVASAGRGVTVDVVVEVVDRYVRRQEGEG